MSDLTDNIRIAWGRRKGLRRFTDAQGEGTYEKALAELQNGQKEGHWMWFIFPQSKGLGHSFNSRLYAIESMWEAQLYLEHPLLGPRLIECVETVQSLEVFRPHAGTPLLRGQADWLYKVDVAKFRSCLMLFAAVDRSTEVFTEALGRHFSRHTIGITSR